MRLSARTVFTASIAWLSTCIPSPAVTTDRTCVFLASPQNTEWIHRAGNISGSSQHCARTECCMGYFQLEDRKPTPVLLSCSIIQTNCPNSSCHASVLHQNYIRCLCSSDFCNMNITFNQQAKQAEYTKPPYSSDLLSTNVLIIPAGALILFLSLVMALKWKILLQHCRPVTPPNPHDVLEVSSIDLDKHLEMQKVVACGHFASVWQGTFQGSSVALKVFPTALWQEYTKEKDVYKLPLMMHSGIVRFLGHGKIGNEFVIVLELATQGSLNAFLSKTECDWGRTLKLARTLSQGLAYLHTDLKMNGVYKPAVAHCDLSSSNVLVRADGSCALCDFGCSTVLQWQRVQGYSIIVESRMQMGTLQYMSPEILEGCVNLSSGRCLLQGDVYSLGLLLWEMLMLCSDLSTSSPVPEHVLPYETELGRNPSLEALLTFVSEKRKRPIIPHLWARVSQGLLLQELLEDCWDHDADARLTAECAANRLASLSLDV
ncbi:anti-Muellerian hormone type-2 receptor isoform X2 [Tachysurus fulvidraco]|uniref:anti-Muellerian hormone type-2 receptor isoform X2 n=1 Tax=Tachysurus fulvidraco TaxID=1234273 RepID=UPI001FEF255E|nr:anti-Muellerian hormone type-2 receptor isoform X2 [Tachysurus fulvidraco]